MIRLLTNLYDLAGALCILTAIALKARFNFSTPYWTWRLHTAFPDAKIPGGKPGFLRFTLEYARWAFRIRRLR